MTDEKPALYPFDFYAIWLNSVANDREEAQVYRRRAKAAESVGSSSENLRWLATRAYKRALHGLAQARVYRHAKEITRASR